MIVFAYRVLFLFLSTVLITLAAGGTALGAVPQREIEWKDLLSPQAAEIDDPFAELREDQLRQLAQVVRIRNLLGRELIPAEGYSAQEEKRMVAELTAQGIDVEWILSQRERVTRERMERAEQVDENLAGQRIRIPGYILPLASNDDRRITEFLLVPWVGACIHTPPPPPNQMIYVSVPAGTEPRGRFSPIWLEGTIELKPSQHNLFLVDGSRQLSIAYAMSTDIISDYSARDSDVLARVEIPEDALKGHSWFQTWQAKISLIFTRAMTGLRDDGTSSAFWFAMLIAFGYGLIHTLGPGHGKAVVISYFVGDGGSFAKGIMMGVKIAIFHVLSSVVVVLLADFAVRQTTGQAAADYRIIRLASYGLIMVIGAVMLRHAIKVSRLSRIGEASPVKDHLHADHRDQHGEHTGPHHDCLACAALESKQGAGNWLALAVGVVPCTGALLVLLFGLANDLLVPSVLMVGSISAGMAVAMSGIGVLAIIGRRVAFGRMSARRRPTCPFHRRPADHRSDVRSPDRHLALQPDLCQFQSTNHSDAVLESQPVSALADGVIPWPRPKTTLVLPRQWSTH